MTLRQTIQTAPVKTTDLIAKLSSTSNQAVKTRESLFAALSQELGGYVEIEEKHLLPLLRKNPQTADLASDTLEGNKDLRARLAKLAASPKDNDEFVAQLAELDKRFQKHVRNERKELLPAVLKALSDDEAAELAATMEQAATVAEQAQRNAKREEASRAKQEVEEAERAASARRADVRAQKQVERNAREAAETVTGAIERSAASAQDGARVVATNFIARTQQVTSEAREALTVLGGSAKDVGDALTAVRASSAVSVSAVAEIRSVWVDLLRNVTRANGEVAKALLQCRSVKQLAELQREFLAGSMRNWLEGSTKVLQITQRTSERASVLLDSRLSKLA